MTYRLALALDSTSLGWCVLNTEDRAPVRITDMGVRIFPDGRDHKSKESLAVARRSARDHRRNLDRRTLRQQRLMACLVATGLMPADPAARKTLESLDPYELRAKALDQKIPLHHLGRALFHINQRRGFKSNRKTDRQDYDSSNTKNAIKKLDAELLATRSRTLGEYLYKQHQAGRPVRVRPRIVENKHDYDFFPAREMCAKEVDAILETQKTHHPQLGDAACDQIRDIIFYQRPLRPVVVGKCRYETGEGRARLALPIVQKFRILHEVNDLKIKRPPGDGVALEDSEPEDIGEEDRQKIIQALLSSRRRTFRQLKTLLKIESGCRFNLETDGRNELKGAETDCVLSEDSCFDEPDPHELVHKLVAQWGLTPDQAEKTADVSLPDGYGGVSKKAIFKMMPYLEKGMKYREAATAAGYDHAGARSGEVFDHLPYYGQVLTNNVSRGTYDHEDKDLPEKYFGKVGNASLHIALNQLRKLVNAVIEVYGAPAEIVLAVGRDLKEPADKIARDQTARTLKDQRYWAKLTRRYLSALFDNEKAGSRVWLVTAQVTALLRDRWGLNGLLAGQDGKEGPADHRQHAIDALVVACTDRPLLETISEAARKLEENKDLPESKTPEPFDGFRTQLEQRLSSMVISYKPDHGGAYKAIRADRPFTVAPLHKNTAYGLIKKPRDQTPAFATRVPVESLLSRAAIESVADAGIRKALLAAVEGLPEGGAEWKQAIEKAAAPREISTSETSKGGTTTTAIMKNGMRRVRVHINKREGTMIGFYQPTEQFREGARPYKHYELKGNYCAEIYSTDKGKKAGQWQAEIISNYHAHQKDFIPQWRRQNPSARLIMRLQINDMVVYESEGQEIICKVKKLSKLKSSGTIFLRPHMIATEEATRLSWEASAKQLQLKNACKISVDIMGRVNKNPVCIR